MEIQLIDSEKFYITQQDKCLYDSNLGTYNDIEIKSIDCPEFYTDVDNDDSYERIYSRKALLKTYISFYENVNE